MKSINKSIILASSLIVIPVLSSFVLSCNGFVNSKTNNNPLLYLSDPSNETRNTSVYDIDETKIKDYIKFQSVYTHKYDVKIIKKYPEYGMIHFELKYYPNPNNTVRYLLFNKKINIFKLETGNYIYNTISSKRQHSYERLFKLEYSYKIQTTHLGEKLTIPIKKSINLTTLDYQLSENKTYPTKWFFGSGSDISQPDYFALINKGNKLFLNYLLRDSQYLKILTKDEANTVDYSITDVDINLVYSETRENQEKIIDFNQFRIAKPYFGKEIRLKLNKAPELIFNSERAIPYAPINNENVFEFKSAGFNIYEINFESELIAKTTTRFYVNWDKSLKLIRKNTEFPDTIYLDALSKINNKLSFISNAQSDHLINNGQPIFNNANIPNNLNMFQNTAKAIQFILDTPRVKDNKNNIGIGISVSPQNSVLNNDALGTFAYNEDGLVGLFLRKHSFASLPLIVLLNNYANYRNYEDLISNDYKETWDMQKMFNYDLIKGYNKNDVSYFSKLKEKYNTKIKTFLTENYK